jgi:hypothetical protein
MDTVIALQDEYNEARDAYRQLNAWDTEATRYIMYKRFYAARDALKAAVSPKYFADFEDTIHRSGASSR